MFMDISIGDVFMRLRVEQGKIYDEISKELYDPKNKTDMESLCNDVNAHIKRLEVDGNLLAYKLGIIHMVAKD